jgi:hypothetical protein
MKQLYSIGVCILIFIAVVYLVINIILPTNENFTNQEENTNVNNINYYEYPETYIEQNGGLDIDILNKNYEGPLKTKKLWDSMTLAQCQDACNSMEGCIGFSRPNTDPESESTCRPRTAISQCHSNRKGNSSQREFASGYTSFIKSDVANQTSKCMGDEKLTLNRMICVKSNAKPFHYITVDNNTVVLKEFMTMGVDFNRQCKFYIVKGLENSNTLSFRMIDNNDINYYLTDDGLGKLAITPLNESKTTLSQRLKASFELWDGLSNPYLTSIRTIANNGKPSLYLSIDDNLKLTFVSSEDAKKNSKSKKNATFDIIDNVTGSSILTTMTTSKESSLPSPSSNVSSEKERFSTTAENDLITEKSRKILDKSYNAIKRYEIYDPIAEESEAIDYNILSQNQSNDESVLLTNAQRELDIWRNGVSKYNDYITNKQNDIKTRLNDLNKISTQVQLRDLARDYYFLKSKTDQISK